ncbi:hypothetical protein HMPREF1984_01900 [Leptotrichia sp. oral taxon 215 str. W9775]|nr:hypothetical protein HMPREF1984_01900 [Leptotrichia sp. oral taxon 215 str. W9775]
MSVILLFSFLFPYYFFNNIFNIFILKIFAIFHFVNRKKYDIVKIL